ncbi:N-acetylmuramoyl-L-alanine amidase family 2 [Haliscomenobacter hydrossis DSM 1100]|uniref:N-acetylmuramoyl-L-alanine amidase family 2 n=2 Tax=Haliscomenobacter TaxID=2349 RepID=F4KZ63_HALH1|nr:N-acetylmuramoyl-L-alanine amidase family 2 [Haliscomenobacter hydrossis DSM 1100]
MNKIALYILIFLIVIYLLIMSQKIIDLRAVLPVHANQKRVFPKRKLAQIDTIIVHHTAGPTTQTVRQIAQYHIGSSSHVCQGGCPGILYHYMINRAGKIYWVNSLENVVYHATPMNTRGIGICLIGNFDKIEPNQVQLDALDYLIKKTRKDFSQPLRVIGHHDACGGCKTCPGANLYPILSKYNAQA